MQRCNPGWVGRVVLSAVATALATGVIAVDAVSADQVTDIISTDRDNGTFDNGTVEDENAPWWKGPGTCYGQQGPSTSVGILSGSHPDLGEPSSLPRYARLGDYINLRACGLLDRYVTFPENAIWATLIFRLNVSSDDPRSSGDPNKPGQPPDLLYINLRDKVTDAWLLGLTDGANRISNLDAKPAGDYTYDWVVRTFNASAFSGSQLVLQFFVNNDPYLGTIFRIDNVRLRVTYTVCGNDQKETGEDCDDGNTVGGDCCSATCHYESFGAACGNPANTQCTNPDTCDGLGTCEANNSALGTPCGDQNIECLVNDSCDGTGNCQDGGFKSPGAACGNPANTQCTNPDTCNGLGACEVNNSASGTPCGDQNIECLVNDSCDGTGNCQDGGFQPPSRQCRPSTEACDPAETCTGSSATCPSDVTITQCINNDGCCPEPGYGCNGANDNDCEGCGDTIVDPATEQCDHGPDVPDDCCSSQCQFEASGTTCGNPSDTECTNPDTCNSTDTCEANNSALGTPCGDQNIECLVNDSCDGTGNCQDGGFQPPSRECRPSTAACDPAETCTGSSATCPSDVTITQCVNDDGCCPAVAGCDATNDNDCGVCGDGEVNATNEECDDGNTNDGDGCSSDCQCEGFCGDGSANAVPECGECCDLGTENGLPGSGCTSSCGCRGVCTESRTECATEADCPPGEGCCGNRVMEQDEECDDGNLQDGDCCSSRCTWESNSCCVPPCEGVAGPHLLTPVSMKAKFKDKDGDGKFEVWTTAPKGRSGDFNLGFAQSVDCSTEEVRLVFSENDGTGGRGVLGEFAIAPGDWTRVKPPKAGTDDEICKLSDKSETVSEPDGVALALIKEKGTKVRYKLKGKSAARIEEPLRDLMRVCVHIGDDAGTGMLGCRWNRKHNILKCDSTNISCTPGSTTTTTSSSTTTTLPLACGTFLDKWGSGCYLGQGDPSCVDPDGAGPLELGDGQFKSLAHVAVGPDASVYVADLQNNRIQKFDSDGNFAGKWGTFCFLQDGPAGGCVDPDGSGPLQLGDGQFNWPAGIAVDENGNIYVVDGNNRVQKFRSAGTFVSKWGVPGTGDGQFRGPEAIAVDPSGRVYVADSGNHRIQKFTSTGSFLRKWGSECNLGLPSACVDPDGAGPLEVGDGQFNNPAGIAVDGGGNVYVSDLYNNRLQKFDANGMLLAKWGSQGEVNGEFDYPHGIAVDNLGNVYVADSLNRRVQKFDPDGNFLGKWGSKCILGQAEGCIDPDGAGPLALGDGQFGSVFGLAAGLAAELYVTDNVNNRVQAFVCCPLGCPPWPVFGGPPAPLNADAATDLYTDSYPQVATDGTGNWVAVWESRNLIGDDTDILVARSTDNGAHWTAPAPLNSNAASDSGSDYYPQVATDRAGNWLAVWQSHDSLGGTIFVDSDILVARSTDNGANWTAPAPLNSNAATDSTDRGDYVPHVTTDGAGTWVAVWQSDDSLDGTIGTDNDILVARSTNNGATWTWPVPLDTTAATAGRNDERPQVTTDGAGNWVTVWESSGGSLMALSPDNGTSWTDPAPLAASGDNSHPQVTTDGAATWVAVWQSSDSLGGTIGTDLDILTSRSTDQGATWTDPVPLNTNADTDSGDDGGWGGPRLATDGAGMWVAVWQSSDSLGGTVGGDTDVLVARSTDNGVNWTAPEALNANAATDSGHDSAPQVTTDSAGHWIVVWNSSDSLSGTIGTDWDILTVRSPYP